MPAASELISGLNAQNAYVAFGIFKGAPPPTVPTPEKKFNVLQQATYLLVMYVAMPFLIVTGIAFFFPEMAPEQLFGMDGVLNLLLGSLDAARAQLEEQGAALAEAAVQAARGLRQLLEHKAGLRLLDKKVIGRAGIAGLDETKITVNLRQWGVSGVEAGEFLRERGLAVELVDAENVLFLVTYADLGPEWPGVVERLQRAWEEMEDLASEDNMFALLPRKGNLSRMPAPQPLRSFREVFYGRKEVCPLREAAGRICAEEVSFYPPGIPVLLPGEVLTPEIITYCKYMKELGLPVHGAADETLATIKVAADSGCGG